MQGRARLQELIELRYGKGLPERKRKPGTYAVYGSSGIVGRHDSYLLDKQTIIVGRKGSIGEVTLTEDYSWPIDTTYYVIIKDESKLGLKYLYYYLSTLSLKELDTSSAVPGLNRKFVLELSIPLPSIEIQTRIVSILARVQQLKEKREKANQLAGKIIQSVFLKMFNDNKFEKQDIRSQVVKTEVRDPRKTPDEPFKYVDISGIDNKTGSIIDVKEIQGRDAPSRARRVIREGDVIVSTVRPNLNATALIPSDLDNQICSTGFAVLRCKSSLNPRYLYTFSRRDEFIQALSAKMKGASYPAVTNDDVLDVKISIPPIDLQNKFAGFHRLLQTISGSQKRSGEEINRLFHSLQLKAFRGELVT